MEHWLKLAVAGIFLLQLTVVTGCRNGSSAVADCLHTYLERDFPSIEAIVFPNKKQRGNKNNKLFNGDKVLLLDGPELADQCHRVVEVVKCLEDIQTSCHYYHEFFPYRHLVTSLRLTVDWMCHDLRNRFRTLLNSFDCLESVRQRVGSKGQPCFQSEIPVNIWQRIVRLQSGTEVCMALAAQVNCTLNYYEECPADARSVYNELNHIFLKAWCTPTEIAKTATLKSSAGTAHQRWALFSSPTNLCLFITLASTTSFY